MHRKIESEGALSAFSSVTFPNEQHGRELLVSLIRKAQSVASNTPQVKKKAHPGRCSGTSRMAAAMARKTRIATRMLASRPRVRATSE
jgi:hypothetical protein